MGWLSCVRPSPLVALSFRPRPIAARRTFAANLHPMVKRSLFLAVTAGLAYLVIDQYVVCPTYRFEAPRPFRGERFHNPYADFRAQEWTLANLHAHTASWLGVTNGRGGAADVYEAYDSMGYGFHAVSDYMRINRHGADADAWVPAYEHGYNIPKSHRLVVGARTVTWKDYPFPLTLSNRQDLLDRLSADTGSAVVINHPAMRIGYNAADLKFLTNYDALEVLNAYEIAFRYWDTALSNGHFVSIVGNDDTHDAGNRRSVGRFATLVHAPRRSRAELIRSLREGRTIGVQVPQRDGMTFPEKAAMLRRADTRLTRLWVDSGLLRADFAAPVIDLEVVGQAGAVRYRADTAHRLRLPIGPDDTYLRIAYSTPDGIRYHFNPVCRADGPVGNRRPTAP
jgi:hypothetical protein